MAVCLLRTTSNPAGSSCLPLTEINDERALMIGRYFWTSKALTELGNRPSLKVVFGSKIQPLQLVFPCLEGKKNSVKETGDILENVFHLTRVFSLALFCERQRSYSYASERRRGFGE